MVTYVSIVGVELDKPERASPLISDSTGATKGHSPSYVHAVIKFAMYERPRGVMNIPSLGFSKSVLEEQV